MYLSNKIFIKPESVVSEIIKGNPIFLLVLEHFGIDDVLNEKSVSELCLIHGISEQLFIVVGNLFNEFIFNDINTVNKSDIPLLITYLRNSHSYYKDEKYPEITGYITRLGKNENHKEMKLVETFFNEYFDEVKEHLEYEENVVFPYFSSLYENPGKTTGIHFSAKEYMEHHSDIESKLSDLKNLLLKYLHVSNSNSVKRKLLQSLFELEYDLKIHSLIEDQILIPLAVAIENDPEK